MPTTINDIAQLLYRRHAGTLDEAGEAELREWIGADARHQYWLETIEEPGVLDEALRERSDVSLMLLRKRLMVKTLERAGLVPLIAERTPTPAAQRVHFLNTAWFRYAAAILLIIGISAYLYTSQKSKPVPEKIIAAKDIPAPAANFATITLADGRKIGVDEANGLLAKEGTVEILKNKNGEIVYSGERNGPIQFNTLTVPRGSQVANIILSDGSKVYLNAASSLKYPVAFMGDERRVEITGEAYFEVSKSAKRKFVVVSGNVVTEVLGTSFNVNAYQDELTTKITLIEGSVKVSSGSKNVIIKPGQQSEVVSKNELKINNGVNLSQVIAWQKGLFMFNNADLRSILKQVSRWYDIEIVYRSSIEPRSFGGGLNRQSPLSEVVKMLESNGVPCRIEASKLIIGKKSS